MAQGFSLLVSLGVAALAALLAHIAIAGAIGWLKGRALARPNQRSSHVVPTPQGGGIVVVPVAIVIAAAAVLVTGSGLPGGAVYVAAVSLAALALMIVGFVDDMRGLGIVLRFSVQCLAVAAAIGLMPADMRIYPAVPLVLERIALMGGLLWFVNLFNFMDGIDLISAVETVSITLGIVLLAALGAVVPAHGYVAAALLGAILGFAWWNRPSARLFLGDAGSLPIGFLLGVLLVHIAAAGETTAALLLPLYYLADATITLTHRLLRGERVWEAHRTHFYQQATRNRFTVSQTVGRIALLNTLLVALAAASPLLTPGWAMAAALTGAAAVAFTLRAFARQHP
jgi:UDP-N-acetylmuramyl pentapeptide phosphotransferase/UDP-N-acetylglucosamine-1-phosphate transferase